MTPANECCESSCLTCNGSTLSDCLTCTAPRHIEGNHCCHEHCGTCNNTTDTSCTGCDLPLVLRGTRCCYERCLTCGGVVSNQCSSCVPGYYLNITSCLPCNSACATCTGSTDATCLTCAAGFTLNPNNANQCLNCHSSCATCFSGTDEFNCASCNLPFMYDPQEKNCFLPCNENQYKPSPINPRGITCLSCHPTCKKCNGPLETDCTECPGTINLSQVSSSTLYRHSGHQYTGNTGKCVCLTN